MSGDMPSVTEQQPLQGTCLMMCPRQEMRQRQKNKRVHILECRPSTSPSPQGASSFQGGVNSLFVKEFARSSAGREINASDVRPLPVLCRTLRYLLAQAYTRTDQPESSVHEFVCDRLRSVRQDLTVQGLLNSPQSTPLLAALCRFYLLQQYKMCESSLRDFDPFLNMKQLQETLACLIRVYKDSQPIQENQRKFTFDLDDEEDEFLNEDKHSVGWDNNSEVNDFTEAENSSRSMGLDKEENEQIENVMQRIQGMSVTEGEESGTSHSRVEASTLPTDVDTPLGTAEEQACGETVESENTQTTAKEEKNRANKIMGENIRKHDNSSRNEGGSSSEGCSWSNIRKVPDTTDRDDSHANNSSDRNSQEASSSSLLQYSEREEMETLHLLLNFDNTEAMQHSLELPDQLKTGVLLSKVLQAILDYLSTGNFIPLMRLFNTLPPLLCVALYLSLPKIQKKALQVLAAGYSSANTRYSLAELTTLLMFSDINDARKTCEHFGLKMVGDEREFVAFHKKDFKADQPMIPLSKAPWLDTRLSSVSMDALLMPWPLTVPSSAISYR